jgi:anti-sigma regulatory factor (Ser/Thr protein kinase)
MYYFLKAREEYFDSVPSAFPELYQKKVDASSQKDLMDTLSELESKLVKFNHDEEEIIAVHNGLLESIQNAQEHGYAFRPGEVVEVTAFLTPDYTIAAIFNIGPAPDIAKIHENMARIKRRELGTHGMGYSIITKNSDMVFLDIFPNAVDLYLVKMHKHKSIARKPSRMLTAA